MAVKNKKAENVPKPKANPGPKPGRLKIIGDWRNAIKRSLGRKKPPEGWPK